MVLQQRATGLSPVRIEEGDTFVYCAVCGNEVPVFIQEGIEISPLRDENGNPLCEGCAIEH